MARASLAGRERVVDEATDLCEPFVKLDVKFGTDRFLFIDDEPCGDALLDRDALASATNNLVLTSCLEGLGIGTGPPRPAGLLNGCLAVSLCVTPFVSSKTINKSSRSDLASIVDDDEVEIAVSVPVLGTVFEVFEVNLELEI